MNWTDHPLDEEALDAARERMVHLLRNHYGINDDRILAAMLKVRRHLFIPPGYRPHADPYGDHPCPVGYGQTISQPYIVAYMTEQLALHPGEKVLEIGTGSGYQAAILAELGADVYTLERQAPLAEHARQTLASQGYAAVQVRTGNGFLGWPERAPFRAIIATCAPETVPESLPDQLDESDGRMILPVGIGMQRLLLLRKEYGTLTRRELFAVTFVPMVPDNSSRWSSHHPESS